MKYVKWHPGYLPRAVDLVITVADWVWQGRPRRHPDDVREIFETHCKPCDFYNPKASNPARTGICLKCTCHVSADASDLANKITLANTACPLDPPKWTKLVDDDESR